MIILPHRRKAFRGGDGSTLLTDLVAWWDMSALSGNEPDQHGSFDLTDSGGVTYNATGGPGSKPCRIFDGTNDYLTVATSGNLTINRNNLTWAGWVYKTSDLGYDCIGDWHSSLTTKCKLAEDGTNKIALWEPLNTNLPFGNPLLAGDWATGSWFSYVLRFNISVGWDLFWNNTKYSNATMTAPSSATDFMLGAYAYAGTRYFTLNGKMGPTCFAKRDWSDAEASEFHASGNGLSYADL
jgi:hypothetical protein